MCGDTYLSLTSQIYAIDEPVPAVFLVRLELSLGVLQLAAVIAELATVGHLRQDLKTKQE